MSLRASVERLVERAPTHADLQFHRLETFAAAKWRREGRPVPPAFEHAERLAALATMSAPPLLERIRAAYDGPLLLVKGPEVAAAYPDPGLRSYRDLDLIVPEADAAQAALLGAGFEVVEGEQEQEELHHRPALVSPGLPLMVEIHARPKWPSWAQAPRVEELFAAAVPAATPVDGVQTLPPAEHAVLLAAHAWAHLPLRRILDLVDVAVVAERADEAELRRVARAWDVEHIWVATRAAADHVLGNRHRPPALWIWARNVPAVRERNVLESHLERWAGPFSAMPFRAALRESSANLRANIRRSPGETRRAKLARTRLTLRDSFLRKSAHDERAGRRKPAS